MLGQLFRNLIILRKLLALLTLIQLTGGKVTCKKRREVATEDNQMNAVTFLYLT